MALRLRKVWLIAGVSTVAIAGLLAWAWADGGEQPLRAISEPVALPGIGR